MIAFACHTWGFNDLTLPEALGTIARVGFRHVAIGTGPHLNPTHLANASTRDDIRQTISADLKTFNLGLADLCVMLPHISLDDASQRQTAAQHFRGALSLARALGAPGITVSPGLVHPADDDEAWDRTVQALRTMLKAAQDAQIALSILPQAETMASTPEQAQTLLDAVPGLQLTLDWAHLIAQNVKPKDIAPLLAHTRQVHIRQAARNQPQTPFDKGRIKADELLTMLREAAYEGFITLTYREADRERGLREVDTLLEVVTLRDALRQVRDA